MEAQVAWPELYGCEPGVADTVNLEFSRGSMRK
jgi:hypothetical protein